MFLIVETKSNIAFATSVASCFAKNSRSQYMEVVKTVLWYLKGSKKYRIIYDGQEILLVKRYLDSNLANNKESHKSTSDFIFILNKGPLSWYSKKQAIVALLFIKTKYIVLKLVAKEAIWLQLLFIKLGFL